jgi:hypothetical protein
VRFPADVWEDMKQFAKDHERSTNGEIIWALREYIRPYPGSQGTSSLKLRSVSTATPIGIESIQKQKRGEEHADHKKDQA